LWFSLFLVLVMAEVVRQVAVPTPTAA